MTMEFSSSNGGGGCVLITGGIVVNASGSQRADVFVEDGCVLKHSCMVT